MLPNLADERAEREAERQRADAARKAGWRRARLGFKLLALPIVLGAAFLIYQCGYAVGYFAALAPPH